MTAGEYTRSSAQLLDEWREKRRDEDGFVRDGVVDPERWFSQAVRPLFLLKEAHDRPGTGDWDLTAYAGRIAGGAGIPAPIWNRLREWTRGLRRTSAERMEPYQAAAAAPRSELGCCAVVNVKKPFGGSVSDMEVIGSYGLADGPLLLRQLELCEPTVIVCGGTAEVLDRLAHFRAGGSNPEWFYGMELAGRRVTVLDYYHPAARLPKLLSYYGLVSIYQQALLREAGK